MSKKVISILSLFVVVVCSMFLFGCKVEKIKFYRESAASDFLNQINEPRKQPKSRPGIINLRDDDSKFNMNFGPSDLNFDMPMRFK